MSKNQFFIVVALTIFTLNIARSSQPDSVRYEFAPVVVTGQRYEMLQKDVAASITIISPASLRSTNLNTVADAISYFAPGVFTSRRAAFGYGVAALAGGNITIRGIGGKPNSQVLVLIDGRPDFQGIFSHPINDAYLLDNIDHIEVLRGPASAVYGTNAMGGVINIITQKLLTTGFQTRISAGYGSYHTQKYHLQHTGAIGKFSYLAGIGFNRSDGHRADSKFDGKNVAVKLGFRINSNIELSFNSAYTPYEYHDPGPEGISLYGYFDYGDITRSSMDVTLNNRFAHTDGTLKIHGNFGEHQLSDGWYSEDQTNGIILFQNIDLFYDLKTTIGFDAKRYGGLAKSNGSKLGTFFNDEIAAYVHVQKILWKKLIIGTGIRFEDNSNFGQESLPKFGIVYHPALQTALRASVAKGFRSPSVKDLFLYKVANADLSPERLVNYELGFNQAIGKMLAVDLCGFYYEGEQLIELAQAAPNVYQNMNVGSNNAKGFEVTIQAKPLKSVTANISYSYLDSKLTLPYAPNKFNFFLNYTIARCELSLYGEYINRLYASYQLSPVKTVIEKLADYSLVHLKLQYTLTERLQLSVGVDNVFDESYQILKGYPMPGRTIFSKMNISF